MNLKSLVAGLAAATLLAGNALAADISEVIIRHLQSKDSSVSVALNEVEPEAWQGVWDTEIAPQMARLIKKPGYSM